MRNRFRHAALSLSLLLGITGGAIAQGPVPNPYLEGERTVNQGVAGERLPNTDYTPHPKDGREVWTQVGGARFENAPRANAEESVGITHYDDNLFAVGFRSGGHGLVGGARCGDPKDTSDFEKSNPDSEQDCVPVLYRYTDDPTVGKSKTWERVDLPGGIGDPGGEERPGFIGAISWIDDDRALVVGGTGTYPRREPPHGRAGCNPPEAPDGMPYGAGCDQAGMARAWLLRRDGSWCELRVGRSEGGCPEIPADSDGDSHDERMRGLTAMDFHSQFEGEKNEELGFVGGLGQIWRWTVNHEHPDGGFTKLYDNESPPTDLIQRIDYTDAPAKLFKFRVRQIRFVPHPVPTAYAVTSGCCSGRDTDGPLTLEYRVRDDLLYGNSVPPRWAVTDRPDPVSGSLPRSQPPGMHQSGARRFGLGPTPDSLYSLALRTGNTESLPKPEMATLSSHASTDSAVEPPSSVSCAPNPRVSTWRMVSLDGPETFGRGCAAEWAVGEWRDAAAAGRGRRGLAYPTGGARPAATETIPSPVTFNHSLETAGVNDAYLQQQLDDPHAPTDRERLEAHLAALDLAVSSYSLNALEMVGSSGTGYAVGDHGAILAKIGSESRAGRGTSEPDPPSVGDRKPASVADRSPYAAPRAAAEGGVVPALAERPRIQLDKPRLEPMGSPDATRTAGLSGTEAPFEDVSQIVMSRDGREGWAIGARPLRSYIFPYRFEDPTFGSGGPAQSLVGMTSFYHYDGTSWRRCDPLGTPRQLEPDPACAAVAGLREFLGGSALNEARRVVLHGAARVPLEKDSDPTNDDEFEVVAIGSNYVGREQPREHDPVILRYKDGRWGFEDRERRKAVTSLPSEAAQAEPGMPGVLHGPGYLVLKDVAFTAPGDGWILGSMPDGGTGINRLFHYDGERWSECVRSADSCMTERIPRLMQEADLRLTGAGERVYLYGTRRVEGRRVVGVALNGTGAPLILYRERSGNWTDGSDPHGNDGAGFDPGCERTESVGNQPPRCVAETDPETGQGQIYGLTVARRGDGRYEGLAIGRFHRHDFPPDLAGQDGQSSLTYPRAVQLRMEHDGGRYRWRPAVEDGAFEDYLVGRVPLGSGLARYPEGHSMALSGGPGREGLRAVVGGHCQGLLAYRDPGAGRSEVAVSNLPTDSSSMEERVVGTPQAVAPDGEGGAWVAMKASQCADSKWIPAQQFFFRLTDRPHRPVFDEVGHPFGDRAVRFTSLSGAADGTVWLAATLGSVARYDRVTGWEMVRIPGWDAGRLVTKESAVNAVAVNAAGIGVAVGEQGRIADIAPRGVELNAAAGRRCFDDPSEPCGTGRDLRAAGVAPDGSAMVGGDALVLLWRPAGGAFRRVEGPGGGEGVRVTGVSLPSADRAYVATDSGYVYRGDHSGGGAWIWRVENLVGRTVLGSERPLRAIAVNGEGKGYAVGEKGLVLYREGDSRQPWRRVRGPGTDDLTAVSLLQGRGDSVLIGGKNGVIWTGRDGNLALARPGDIFQSTALVPGYDTPENVYTGPVVGFALLPGVEEGQAEAWAGVQAMAPRTNQLLHFASDESEPLLRPGGRAEPLPDSAPRREGELAFGAFGKSECQKDPRFVCSEMLGSRETADVITRRVASELASPPGGPLDFSLHTGDVSDTTGYPANSAAPVDREHNPDLMIAGLAGAQSAWRGRRKHARFNDFVLDPIERAGLPVFGAIGAGDTSRATFDCYDNGGSNCHKYGDAAKAGESSSWREAMASRRAPWGAGGAEGPGGLELSETPGSRRGAQELPEAKVDPDGPGFIPERELKSGARTHYSVEIARGERKLARLVVADTSMRALTDANQNPVERDGQLRWLERVLCFEGQTPPGGGECTRSPGQQAIVLSNTPTYSPGPGAADATQLDASAMERVLLQYRASVVVSGRLGWNGRYWATAAGVHEPCPGSGYQEKAPEPGSRVCGRGEDQVPGRDRVPSADRLSEALGGAGVAPPAVEDIRRQSDEALNGQNVAGLLPFVVAAAAGGKFGPNGEQQSGTPSAGYFHGYTIVRLPPDADPRNVVVEQRPILDWVNLTASAHVLRPGQRLRLRGTARAPIGYNGQGSGEIETRYLTIDSPAITHSYDLLETDPDKPYLPRKDADGQPVPLAPDVATIDRTTGRVKAGRGSHPRTYALAVLTVGQHTATWPLVFEPRKSFTPPPPAKSAALPLPRPIPAIKTLAQSPSIPPQPPAQAPPPVSATPSFPPTPALPTPPPPFSGTTAQPPAPPAPPPPPPPQLPTALDLLATPPSVPLAPQATVIPPPAPPIQPAPPGGARREARQRQAAVQKGEEGGGSSEVQELGGDAADKRMGPEGSPMRRRDRDRPEPSFSVVSASDQPSAWARTALYGGGVGLAAMLLAFSWAMWRPRPRERGPRIPAPAWSRERGRFRRA